MSKRDPQLALALPPELGWGGARDGAGRKPLGREPGISHHRSLELDDRFPAHVTVRVREHVWNLRSRRCHAVIAAALRAVMGRTDFRVVHFSIQGNHIHLVVEADGGAALARGMKALLGRMGRHLNGLMGRRGSVFQDRYHAHVLRSPTEVRHALAYVLGNFSSHTLRRGGTVSTEFVDPYSSSAARGPDGEPPPVAEPRSWLLRSRGVVAREPESPYASAA